MDGGHAPHLPPWAVFLIPATVAAAIIGAIVLAGPIAGFGMAAVAAVVIVGTAIRMEPGRSRRIRPRPERRRLRDAALRFTGPLALGAVGIVVVVATGGTARVLGWGVIALALTLAISLAFLEVGYSEERALARERRRSRTAGDQGGGDAGAGQSA